MSNPSVSPRGITILGATGSIGLSTLDVLSRHPKKFQIIALTANRQIDRLFDQCRRYQPEYAVMVDEDAATKLATKIKNEGLTTKVLAGVQGLVEVAQLESVKIVVAAIVGAAGLVPTISAAEAGKQILLANKEALVMSGPLFMDTVRNNNAVLLPIDSEHNAIFQCMPVNFAEGLEKVGVRKIMLTASGGPFWDASNEKLRTVTPDQACAHPKWVMGRKISVDSATMMNKGLEVIEACWLFHTSPAKVDVVIHPQSVVHSMVQYADGSVLAQLGNPDMRTPIAHALAWPERFESGTENLDIFDIARLDFFPPNNDKFPCIPLAYQAMERGGTATCILNAANEIAVEAFLNEKLAFLNIARLIEDTMTAITVNDVVDLDTIIHDDAVARNFASERIASYQSDLR